MLPSLARALPQRPFPTLSSHCPRRTRGFYEGINFAFTGFFTFLTIAIVERTGVDDTRYLGVSAVGLFAILVIATGAMGSFIGGRLGERYSPERLLTLLTFAPVPVLLLLGASSGWLLLAVAPFASLAFNIGEPSLGSLIGRYLPTDMHGKGFAFLFGVGQAIGSPVGVLAGWITHSYGVNWVLPVMAAFPLVAVPILFYFVWPSASRTPVASGTPAD